MGNKNRLRPEYIAEVKRRRKIVSEYTKNKEDKNEGVASSQFILDCSRANACGDGILYKYINNKKVRYNYTTGQWLLWNGHHWEVDVTDLAYELVEEVSNVYAQEKQKIESQINDAYQYGNKDQAKQLEILAKQLDRNIHSLRGVPGRRGCLEFARSSPGEPKLSTTSDQYDQNPYLLAGPNGVCDLQTGLVRPGRREDNILTATGVPFPEDILNSKPKTWEKYLWESLENLDVINFLQRFIGYCLTGLTIEQVFLILSGLGRNGKTVFAEIFRRILGRYAIPIQAEMLLDQGRGRAASAPSPDIMSLHGKRVVFASEPDENRRFSIGKIKWFTGSDTLTGRNPHDRYETRFEPTHKLVMLTNNDPHASADDYAFWNRVCKVDWPFSFVDKPSGSTEKL
jgi:putative DNA primase/helicase